MSFTKEEAEAQVKQLMEEERWEEALLVYRRIGDELHEKPRRLGEVVEHVRPDVAQLRAEDTGSSLWLLGAMFSCGRGGVEWDWEEAFRCFSRAAEKGHLLSRWQLGSMIADRLVVPGDKARGYAMIVEAAEAGCVRAFDDAAFAYEKGFGVPQSYRRAAQWYLKTNSYRLAYLLRNHPLECAPLGEWRPELTPLVPHPIFLAMRTTMLLCKRLHLPQYVALLIASYVCTAEEV